MSSPKPLLPGKTYHIYNRGINRSNLFFSAENYRYFLKLYAHHVAPVVDTFAYCLMPNHFHFLVKVHEPDLTGFKNLSGLKPPSQHFSNLFNAYTKAINKRYGRTGALFQRPFGRIEVRQDGYFLNLITYIHRNPQTHGFVDDFRAWDYSSYHAILADKPTRVAKTAVCDWFGSRQQYIEHHAAQPDETLIAPLIADDFV
jgi:putative transposase